MDCLNCETQQIKEVPLLVCGCYICPDCYCRLKSSKIHYCLTCNKKLRRSTRKKNIIKQIHELNHAFAL